MSEKIALAACSGMSPNGLISRVSCDDISKSEPKVISICMGATSGERTGFREMMKEYPSITVNGCDGQCANKILAQRGVLAKDTIDVKEELSKTDFKANDTSRLDAEGEKCVSEIKKIVYDKIEKNLD